MFNYECSQKSGEVVGTCLDGFLFGACCQLPSSEDSSHGDQTHSAYPQFNEFEDIDHVPGLPILLKPDGTPVGTTSDGLNTKASTPSDAFLQSQVTELQDKFPSLLDHQTVIDDLSLPNLITHTGNNDIQDNQSSMSPVTTLLSPNQVLQIADPVDQLPALFSQGISHNNHTSAETVLLNKNGSALTDNETKNPDQLFVPINRSTQLPSSYTITERTQPDSTIKSENPIKYYSSNNPELDMQTTPGLVRVSTINSDTQTENKKHDDSYNREEIAINHIISILNGSNPSGSTSPSPSTASNNLKLPHRDSIQQINSNYNNGGSLIHTWVTVEDTSLPSTSSGTFPYSYYKPTTKPTNFYYYDTAPSTTTTTVKSASTKPASYTGSNINGGTTSYGSSSSIYSYTTRPTTNPPAPTVIVLGPLGTEFTTVTSPKPYTKRPTNPTTSNNRPTFNNQNKPNITTTITHNISTIISTANSPGSSTSGNVISTSYINVSMKDKPTETSSELPEIITKESPTLWTTISTISKKPAFQLKPVKLDFEWPNDELEPVQTIVLQTTKNPTTSSSTTITNEDETAPPDDLSAFPPDRNPNLTITPVLQQDKPNIVKLNNTGYPDFEIISENEITTPSFIEDDVLGNKVDDFVHKIVDSLQGDFGNLQEVVYSRQNVTTITTSSTTTALPSSTKKPPTITKKPTPKPGQTVTKKPTIKRPNSTIKPATSKPTKGKPSSQIGTSGSTTKKPNTTGTKRPKPPKKPSTFTSSIVTTTEIMSTSEIHNLVTQSNVANDFVDEPSTTPDYRRGIYFFIYLLLNQ